jgi:methylmalonyl-CoA/ethylmalonyl-CoA epimerase
MSNLSQSHIGQIAVVCKDVARAKTFYKDALGLQHLFDAGPGLTFFQCGGVRLMLSKAEGEPTGTSVLYFFISDIENTRKDLIARGVRFIDEPHMIARMPDHELWLSAFRDSEDNMLALMEEKREHVEPKLWAVG